MPHIEGHSGVSFNPSHADELIGYLEQDNAFGKASVEFMNLVEKVREMHDSAPTSQNVRFLKNAIDKLKKYVPQGMQLQGWNEKFWFENHLKNFDDEGESLINDLMVRKG